MRLAKDKRVDELLKQNKGLSKKVNELEDTYVRKKGRSYLEKIEILREEYA